VDSSTEITVTDPSSAFTGTVDVTVTVPGVSPAGQGTSATSAADHFTYTNSVTAPTVTSVSPDCGLTGGGQSVNVYGKYFTGATSVKFGGVAATGVVVDSSTEITCTDPSGTGTVTVSVTTPGGTGTD